MRHAVWGAPMLALACVALPEVTFRCSTDADCPSEQICSSDSLCRLSVDLVAVEPRSGPVGTPVTLSGPAVAQTKQVRIGQRDVPIVARSGQALIIVIEPDVAGGRVELVGVPRAQRIQGVFTVLRAELPASTPRWSLASGIVDDGFGADVSLSADGRRLLVGAPNDTQGRGAVWQFDTLRGDEGLRITADPFDGGETSLGFGGRVALSVDGTQGAVSTNGSPWVLEPAPQRVADTSSALAGPGRAVGVSGDGMKVASIQGQGGGVHLFEPGPDGGWSVSRLDPLVDAGASVSWETLATSLRATTVGAAGRVSGDAGIVCAWAISEMSDAGWRERGSLCTPGVAASAPLGLDVSGDGDTLAMIVGAKRLEIENRGSGGRWVVESPAGARFGGAVRVRFDGQLAFVAGDEGDDDQLFRVWLYELRPPDGWSLVKTLLAPRSPGTTLSAVRLSVSADGQLVALSTPGPTGRVWVFGP